jgi:hypothetical protein
VLPAEAQASIDIKTVHFPGLTSPPERSLNPEASFGLPANELSLI